MLNIIGRRALFAASPTLALPNLTEISRWAAELPSIARSRTWPADRAPRTQPRRSREKVPQEVTRNQWRVLAGAIRRRRREGRGGAKSVDSAGRESESRLSRNEIGATLMNLRGRPRDAAGALDLSIIAAELRINERFNDSTRMFGFFTGVTPPPSSEIKFYAVLRRRSLLEKRITASLSLITKVWREGYRWVIDASENFVNC